MSRRNILIYIICSSCFFTGHFTNDLLNSSCIKIPDFPDQCLFFVTGGTYAESSYNCRYSYDGQLACCDIFLKFVRNFIPNTDRLFWIGLQTEKRSKNSLRSYFWSNYRGGFASSEAVKLLDGASSRDVGVGLRFPDDEDEDDSDVERETDDPDPIETSCVAVRANKLHTMNCDTYLALALCQRGRSRQCHTWKVAEGHCFYDSRGVCVTRILARYHEADDGGKKCGTRIKRTGYKIEPCSQPHIACKTSCHASYWSSWSPCRVNCSRQKWAPDVERAPLPYACFAECNQTGLTFRERVSFMIGGTGNDKVDALHCPVEYARNNCTGVCGGAGVHLHPQPFGVADYDTATDSKILINTDDWGSILPSGDAKNAKTIRNRLAIIIFLVAISVGTFLIILLIFYRKYGWKTAWLATKSTSSRDVLPLGQRDAWYKVHPKPCRCPKSASNSCEEMRKKQANNKAAAEKTKSKTFFKTNADSNSGKKSKK